MQRALAAAVLSLSLLTPSLAVAAPDMPGWGVEIRLGPYQPRMGNQTEQAYYDDFFEDRSPLMKGLEFERYLFDYFGNLGVLLRVGHWKVSGNSRTCRDAAGTVVDCTDPSSATSEAAPDKSAIVNVPITVGAVFRFDLLKDEWSVPLVPYAKAGLVYSLWWFQASGETAVFGGAAGGGSGEKASGATAGFFGSLGLQFNLDWIESSEGGKAFIDSYLFAEVEWLKADSFGNREKPDMSDLLYTVGLAFDFE